MDNITKVGAGETAPISSELMRRCLELDAAERARQHEASARLKRIKATLAGNDERRDRLADTPIVFESECNKRFLLACRAEFLTPDTWTRIHPAAYCGAPV